MSEVVYVIATIKAKPGKEAAAEVMFNNLVTETHKEAGCLVYALHRRIDQPGTYYFVEKWASQAALDEHLGSAHIKAALAKQEELLTLLDIGIVSPMGGGDPAKGIAF